LGLSIGLLATPGHQTIPTRDDRTDRLDNELLLSILDALLEVTDRVTRQHGDSTLPSDRSGVVPSVDVMNRNARFRVLGLKNRLKDSVPVHPLAPELRQ
jgi:hypothetical protein